MRRKVSPNVEQSQHKDQEQELQRLPQAPPTTGPAKRQRICQVCGDDAKSYHLNYGVSSCLSCRAFFRRVVQTASGHTLTCKRDGRCHVTLETRKRCPRCRFVKCLQTGMQERAVLNEKQKKQRFWRMIKKQKEMEKVCRKDVAEGCVSLPKRDGRKHMSRKQKHLISETKRSSLLESKLLSVGLSDNSNATESHHKVKEDVVKVMNLAPQTQGSVKSCYCKHPYFRRTVSVDLREREQIANRPQYIRHTWAEALSWNVDRNSQFSWDFLCSHQGQFALTRSGLRAHLTSLADAFRDFALRQPEFRDLTLGDQHRLLCRNVPTFVQFVIGMYLTAENAQEQIRWMLLDCEWKSDTRLYFIFLHLLFVLNEKLSLLNGDCCEYLEQLVAFYPLRSMFSFNEVPFFALSCLFSVGQYSLFDEEEIVHHHRLKIAELITWKHRMYEGASLTDLASALLVVESMTATFEGMVDWESDVTKPIGVGA